MVVFKKNSQKILAKSSAATVESNETAKIGSCTSIDLAGKPSRASARSGGSLNSLGRIREEDEGGTAQITTPIPADIMQWISKSFKHEMVGVLVSDMSGFTRLTRAHGIIHFASVIIRMRQVCLPILHHYGAALITTEADDFICIFRSAAAAVKAAHSMIYTVEKYNEALPPERKHFALTLNGIGIDFGRGPLVDKNNKLHGKTFSNAYLLGEELSEKGCVLISGNVRSAVCNDPKFASSRFEEAALDQDDAGILAGEVGGLYNYGEGHLDAPFTIPGVDDNRYLQKELVCLAQRHSPTLSSMELEKLDTQIKNKFMSERTVLMFDFDYGCVEDAETQMRLEFECLAGLDSIMSQFHGEEVEDVMYLFENPVDAVLATILIREQVELWRWMREAEPTKGPSLSIKGYGLHCGQILRVPGTDVHWGDPINTASKLGQDLAENGDIIVSDVVYDIVKEDQRVKAVIFDQIELVKSKVKFKCYKASRPSTARLSQKIELGLRTAPPPNTNRYCGWWETLFPRCSLCTSCCDNDSVFNPQTQEYTSSPPVISKHYAEVEEKVYPRIT